MGPQMFYHLHEWKSDYKLEKVAILIAFGSVKNVGGENFCSEMHVWERAWEDEKEGCVYEKERGEEEERVVRAWAQFCGR